MYALVTSLGVHQQMLLQLLPKIQLLTPSPRSLLRDAPRASAMVTARKAAGPSLVVSATPSSSTTGTNAMGLPKHYFCALSLKSNGEELVSFYAVQHPDL